MLKGKRILITQSALHFLAGSETVTLELAEVLKKMGAEVLVFCWFLSDPMKAEFSKRSIEVITDDSDKRLLEADIVWVHHQVIPRILLEDIRDLKKKPSFIYYHMSANEEIFLEQPYLYGLEELLSSKSYCVSVETKRMLEKHYPGLKVDVLPNWSPDEYYNDEYIPRNEVLKILVVSNHPPEEIRELGKLCEDRGVDFEIIGMLDEVKKITPVVLREADVVITIGKTVQYCIAQRVPVFVYDHFGGPGYLTKNNYLLALENNFSGRGFSRLSTEELYEKIMSGFGSAKQLRLEIGEDEWSRFNIRKMVQLAISNIEPRSEEIKIEHLRSSIGALCLAKERVIADNRLLLSEQENRRLLSVLGETRKELQRYSEAYNRLRNSRTVVLLDKIKNIAKKPFRKKSNVSKCPIVINREEYETEILKDIKSRQKLPIIGLIREKNESLILEDTLSEMCKIVDGFILLDDNSDDSSIEIARRNQKCLAIIKHKKTVDGDRSSEESVHRELLLELAKRYDPDWIFYQDADERVEKPKEVRKYILENLGSDISGIEFQLFDAYMTEGDSRPYKKGEKLFGFRKKFGIERRDILMAWKNTSTAAYKTRKDLREPDGIDRDYVVRKFFVQHYGKALSVEQWEETCDYYIAHFPGYAKKWKARKGRAIHGSLSDFGTRLMSWNEVKKNEKKLA